MKTYKSYNDVQQDLKLLSLERRIALENMKLNKNRIGNELEPKQWMKVVFQVTQKYGIYFIIRRLLR